MRVGVAVDGPGLHTMPDRFPDTETQIGAADYGNMTQLGKIQPCVETIHNFNQQYKTQEQDKGNRNII